MSERRFVVEEVDDDNFLTGVIEPVSASELKRRLRRIMEPHSKFRDWHSLDEAIDLLLHGEGKELRIKDQLVRLNGTDNPEPVQPDLSKFRLDPPGLVDDLLKEAQSAEWEAWVEKMPYDGTVSSVWQNDLQAWFRTMPRRRP